MQRLLAKFMDIVFRYARELHPKNIEFQ